MNLLLLSVLLLGFVLKGDFIGKLSFIDINFGKNYMNIFNIRYVY